MSVCLLCGAPVDEPVDLAPLKAWWPLMVRCTSGECPAAQVYAAEDADALEQRAFADPDKTEEKFAYTIGEHWYVSTIYRRSSAALMPGHYYETQAFVRVVGETYRAVAWDSAGYPKRALRGHAILAKRLRRLHEDDDDLHVDPDAGDLTNQYRGLTPA